MDADDAEPSRGAPAPGDRRDGGPRPRATVRDAWWGLLTVGLVGITVVQLVGLTVALVGLEERPTGGGLFLGFLITVVWLLTIYWLAMGAWRRSVWGCPFRHTADAPEVRRCARHRVIAREVADTRAHPTPDRPR